MDVGSEYTTVSVYTTAPLTAKPTDNTKTTTWILFTIFCIVMVILITLGNIIVLATTLLDKRLHQPNKYFIACLAIADLFVGTFSLPIRLYLRFNVDEAPKRELCQFWIWVDIACEVASVVTLTVISVDRYIKISMPFKYRSLMTTLKSLILIIMIWFISILAAALSLVSYDGSLVIIAQAKIGCAVNNPIYMAVIAILFFFLPLLVMSIMYVLIFTIAHQRQKMCRKGTLGHSHKIKKKRFGEDILRELKTVRMLFLVVVTFMLCWGPFFVILLINTFNSYYVVRALGPQKWTIIASIFFTILPSFNSFCNPIIYACFDREYSKAFKILLRRIFCCTNDPFIMKLSKSSSTQSFRLRDFRSRRTSAGLQSTRNVEENNLASIRNLLH